MNPNRNYSHVLHVVWKIPPSEEIKELVWEEIVQIIEGKKFTYTIENHTIAIQWKRLKGEFYTNVNGFYGDVAVQKHTKLLWQEVLQLLTENLDIENTSFVFHVTRPLTKQLVLS